MLIPPLLQGLFLGAGLIVAIGAQNAYVIRIGVMKRHVFAVTTACFLIDAGLIWAGAAGLGAVIAGSAWLSRAAAWGGAAFLFAYGGRAAWAVFRPKPYDWDSDDDGRLAFAVGAAVASALWFYGVGYGAALAAPFFRTLTGARVLDGCIWVIMWAVAGSLLLGVLGG